MMHNDLKIRGKRRPGAAIITFILVANFCPTTSNAWVPATAPAITMHRVSGLSTTILRAKKISKKKSRTSNKSTGGGGGFARSTKSDGVASSVSLSSQVAKSTPAIVSPVVTTAPSVHDAKELAEYTKYYQEEVSRQEDTTTSGIVQISSSPLMFTMDNFMDPGACSTLTEEDSESFCLEFRHRVSQLFNGQIGAMDGMKFNYASSRDANNDASEQITFPDGVHMDTNNDSIFRHLTAILYLNGVPIECGGATLFPLARAFSNDPALQASRRLLDEKIGHTRSCGVVRKSGVKREVDAALVESRSGSQFLQNPLLQGAIRVQPKAGKLLLFFSRTCSGMEDPRSWHGGERLRDGNDNSITEKRILTIFKEVDYGSVQPTMEESTFETYLSHQIQSQGQSLLRLSQLEES